MIGAVRRRSLVREAAHQLVTLIDQADTTGLPMPHSASAVPGAVILVFEHEGELRKWAFAHGARVKPRTAARALYADADLPGGVALRMKWTHTGGDAA